MAGDGPHDVEGVDMQALLANLAVIAMMLIAWNAVAESLTRLPPTVRNLLFGLSMAIGAVASMAMSFEVAPGIFFDLRNPLVAISALFGGLPAAIITAACALAYRAFMGGAVGFGAFGIMLSVLIGLAGRQVCRGDVSWRELVLVAATSSLATPVVTVLYSWGELRIPLRDIAGHAVVSFMAVLLFGVVILREGQRRLLAETNAYFRWMVDILPDCLNVKDLDGRFIAANPATARMMKAADTAALIGRTDADFYPTDLARRFREDERAVLFSGVATVIEQRGLRPDGTASWLATLKAPARDAAGNIVGLVTSNRDITERKALQDKLAETQVHLDQALKNMNDGLAIYDRKGELLFCNERYRQHFPASAHLRVPGAMFDVIVAASVKAGEENLPDGVPLTAHIEACRRRLFEDGEYLIHKPDGSVYLCRTKVLENGDSLRVVADITEQRNHERTLEHQALHDTLTGLPNRAYFNREMARRLAKARTDGGELVVMMLDLDRFKQVNDNFGHAAGDALLVEVSRRLASVARSGDFVARLGGDEFALLLNGKTSDEWVIKMAARISKILARPMAFGDAALTPGGTMGYTIWPNDPSDAEGLLRNADKALYDAKANGRGSWKGFEPSQPIRATG